MNNIKTAKKFTHFRFHKKWWEGARQKGCGMQVQVDCL